MFAAGVAAGAANAVAGGGSAVSFPVLVFVGLPPVTANATSAVGLWPGGVAAAWSYRSRIRQIRPRTRGLIAPALAGGLLGAWLLINLPAAWFAALAPFLVIGAAASVGIEPLVRRWVGRDPLRTPEGGFGAGFLAVLGVAIYGGYFGAGMGLMLLTTLALLGLTDLQHANGVKNLLAVAIKLPAILYFIVLGALRWDATVIMGVGALVGGWLAGYLIQKVEAARLRWAVVIVGVVLGVSMLAH